MKKIIIKYNLKKSLEIIRDLFFCCIFLTIVFLPPSGYQTFP